MKKKPPSIKRSLAFIAITFGIEEGPDLEEDSSLSQPLVAPVKADPVVHNHFNRLNTTLADYLARPDRSAPKHLPQAFDSLYIAGASFRKLYPAFQSSPGQGAREIPCLSNRPPEGYQEMMRNEQCSEKSKRSANL